MQSHRHFKHFNNSAHLQIPVLLPGKLLPNPQMNAPCFRSDGILNGTCSFASSLPAPGASIKVVPAPLDTGDACAPHSAARASTRLAWQSAAHLVCIGSLACRRQDLGPVRPCVLRSGCTQGLQATLRSSHHKITCRMCSTRVRLAVTMAGISVSHQAKERVLEEGECPGRAWHGTESWDLRLDRCFLGVPCLSWFPQAHRRPHFGVADTEHHGMDEM